MKNTRKILIAAILVLTMMVGMTAIVASAADEAAPQIGDFWVSDGSLYTVEGKNPVNIKYNGAGNTFACVGADVAGLAAGNDTFTATVTNNGSADSRVRIDIQATTKVGNTDACNVSATGSDVWTDTDWGGSHFTVPAGQSVDITIVYDGASDRGAVKNLVIFADSSRNEDTATYNADITVSNITFSNSKAPADPQPKPEAPKTHVLESKDLEVVSYSADNSRVSAPDPFFTIIFKNGGKVDDSGEVTFSDGYTASRRINFGGKINVKDGVVNKSAIEIVTDGPVNVKVWWVCGSSSDERYIGIITADKTEHAATEKGQKGEAYIDTLTLEEAGTYYVGPLGNGSYIYKVEVSPVVAEPETPACEHEYMFTCDQHCMLCGELTNSEAAHTIKHVDAVAPGCETVGNVEYWCCEVCGSAWTDEALTQVTNAMSVKLPATGHLYVCDVCAYCYNVHPTFLVGDTHYVINDLLIAAEADYRYIYIAEPGLYEVTGGAPLTIFIWNESPNAVLTGNEPYVWNVDMSTFLHLSSFLVEFKEAGLYWIGFNFAQVGDLREFDINIAKHAHSFADATCTAPKTCKCGATEGDALGHSFVDGKCACGESDPNYVPPHEHKFVEGKCECGESDPNYVPPHEHNFVEGKCECGESDPNYVPPTFLQTVLATITAFFAKVGNFFSGIFSKIGGFFGGLFNK